MAQNTRRIETMSEFIFLYRTSASEQREHMGTPELAQQSMDAWLSWMRELETKGHIKDMGQPLDMAGKVVRAGKKRVVTDGPYTEAKDLILGYSIVKARDLEQAVELSAGCPILEGASGSVEVRPVLNMMG
jgi:hypothetical protein